MTFTMKQTSATRIVITGTQGTWSGEFVIPTSRVANVRATIDAAATSLRLSYASRPSNLEAAHSTYVASLS